MPASPPVVSPISPVSRRAPNGDNDNKDKDKNKDKNKDKDDNHKGKSGNSGNGNSQDSTALPIIIISIPSQTTPTGSAEQAITSTIAVPLATGNTAAPLSDDSRQSPPRPSLQIFSSGTSPNAATEPTDSSAPSVNVNAGVIAAAIIGALIGIMAIIIVTVVLLRRRKRHRLPPSAEFLSDDAAFKRVPSFTSVSVSTRADSLSTRNPGSVYASSYRPSTREKYYMQP